MNVAAASTCGRDQLLCRVDSVSPYLCVDFESFECGLVGACPCPPVKGDSDIAGIGVLIAFGISALLTWICTLAYLVLEEDKPRRVNIIDEYFSRKLFRPIRKRVENADILAACFFRVTFTLSDQQLVTGIAMLIAGLKLLARGDISVYHFSIVRELAFFCSNSHLLSFLVLSSSFSGDRKLFTRKGVRRRFALPFTTKWRFFCIFVNFVLLLIVAWVTASREWDYMYECPASCVPRGLSRLGGPPLGWAVATTYFLVTGYGEWALQLCEQLLDHDRTLRKQAGIRTGAVGEMLGRRLRNRPIALRICQALRKVALIVRFYTFSQAIELLTVLGWFIANCVWTIQDKIAGYNILTKEEWRSENAMGFGQIVPLVLLMLPLMVFFETYHEHMEEQNDKQKTAEMDPLNAWSGEQH